MRRGKRVVQRLKGREPRRPKEEKLREVMERVVELQETPIQEQGGLEGIQLLREFEGSEREDLRVRRCWACWEAREEFKAEVWRRKVRRRKRKGRCAAIAMVQTPEEEEQARIQGGHEVIMKKKDEEEEGVGTFFDRADFEYVKRW